MTRLMLVIYRYIARPLWPGGAPPMRHCRFEPTCSRYAVQAVRIHGPVRGTWLAVRRLSRCHPWNPGGFDPVEPR